LKKRFVVLLAVAGLIGSIRLSGSSPPPIPEPSDEALRLAQTSIIFDGHNDVPHWVYKYQFDLDSSSSDERTQNAEWVWVFGDQFGTPDARTLRTHTDFQRMEEGALDAVFFSIFVHPVNGASAAALRDESLLVIKEMSDQIENHQDRIVLACTPEDVRSAFSDGRMAGLYGLEGGHAISAIDDARTYYEAGVRYVTMTWAVSNQWAGSSSDSGTSDGLTEAGRDLVEELNNLGIIIDVSHVSDPAFWDILDATRTPIIASHSSVRALVDSERNLTDEMLRALAEIDGLIMINFGGIAIDPRKSSNLALVVDMARHWGFSDPSINQVADHIEHAIRIAGIDHVGLGSDFDGTLFLPAGLKDVSDYPRLVQVLLDRGYSESGIKKILGENLLRVMDEIQSAALTEVSSCQPN